MGSRQSQASLPWLVAFTRIKSARKAKNLTQEKLAEQINISTNHIAEIKNKKTIPSFEIMCSLCKILNLSLDDIIFDTESDSIKQINLLLSQCSEKQLSVIHAMIEAMLQAEASL